MKQKKILLIGVGLAGIMFPAWAQYESITVGNSCSYFGETMPDSVISFQSDAEAEQVITNILDHSGLRPNFRIQAAGVPNAAAVVRHGKRYILYNQRFMRNMRRETGNKWAAVSIMAHEIGHHLQGHTLEDGGSRPATELEADEYSGAMIQKLGGNLDDALIAMETIGSDYGSITHPAKRDRLAAISSGFTRSEQLSTGSRSGGSRDSDTVPKDPDTVPKDPDTGVDPRCESEGRWVVLDKIRYDARGYVLDDTRWERSAAFRAAMGLDPEQLRYVARGYVLDGKQCGEWTFDFGSQQILVVAFKNGKRHGPLSYVCPVNDLFKRRCTEEGNYKNDKKHGHWETIAGITSSEGNYKNDKKDGPWIEISSTYVDADRERGRLISEGSYKNGKKHGHWEITTKTSYRVSQKTEVYLHGILLETIKHY